MRWKKFKRSMKDFNIGDYVKSVYVNKYALTGYLSAGACVGLCCAIHTTPGDISELLFFGLAKGMTGIYAVLSLEQTMFGVTTMMTYQRSKRQLSENGSLPKEFSKLTNYYCDEVGMNLAIKESGLEKVIYS